MSYRTITTVLTDAEADATALAAAMAIAAREDGHLDVHCLGIDPTRYDALTMGPTAVVFETGLREAQEQADALQGWVTRKLPRDTGRASVQATVVPFLGIETLVARLTRYADLVVTANPHDSGSLPLQINLLEAALFGTSAPVLVVPAEAPPRDFAAPFGRVMVAWDESDESLSAIRKAMPVLRAAQHVDVVMVDPQAGSHERSDPGGALCVMLARQGVRAEVSILARTLPRVSEVLMRFAREHAVEVVVMGAYGHSRFREAILGGATREMLGAAALPLLMAR